MLIFSPFHNQSLFVIQSIHHHRSECNNYIKTDNVYGNQNDSGAALVAVINGQSYYSTPVSGTTDSEIDSGWQKVRTKFTLSGETMVTVRCDLVHASGIAWFDSIQIDRGETDSKFNLIYNPSFEEGQYLSLIHI